MNWRKKVCFEKCRGQDHPPPSLHAHPLSIHPAEQSPPVLPPPPLPLSPVPKAVLWGKASLISPWHSLHGSMLVIAAAPLKHTHTNCHHGLKTPSFSRVNPCPSICLRLYLPVSPIAICAFLSVKVHLCFDILCVWVFQLPPSGYLVYSGIVFSFCMFQWHCSYIGASDACLLPLLLCLSLSVGLPF